MLKKVSKLNKKIFSVVFIICLIAFTNIASANEDASQGSVSGPVDLLTYDENHVVIGGFFDLQVYTIQGGTWSTSFGEFSGLSPNHIVLPASSGLKEGDKIPQELIDNYNESAVLSPFTIYTDKELDTKVKALEGKLSEYETKLGTLEELQAKISELEKTVGSIEEMQNRIDQLEERLPQTQRPSKK
ncbi:hypothetical protein L1999_09350 [Neobacillus drentensis]|uniref:hypothetical protein n=1 Tax=Neobacillus drentensis TaxID=220684 RepID=UPI001F2FEE96|nr:hypothetical protein [Neobacillus drentensis]ULT58710.1 hypothetical protein L1999_09350 [Neobacillus drentensis]